MFTLSVFIASIICLSLTVPPSLSQVFTVSDCQSCNTATLTYVATFPNTTGICTDLSTYPNPELSYIISAPHPCTALHPFGCLSLSAGTPLSAFQGDMKDISPAYCSLYCSLQGYNYSVTLSYSPFCYCYSDSISSNTPTLPSSCPLPTSPSPFLNSMTTDDTYWSTQPASSFHMVYPAIAPATPIPTYTPISTTPGPWKADVMSIPASVARTNPWEPTAGSSSPLAYSYRGCYAYWSSTTPPLPDAYGKSITLYELDTTTPSYFDACTGFCTSYNFTTIALSHGYLDNSVICTCTGPNYGTLGRLDDSNCPMTARPFRIGSPWYNAIYSLFSQYTSQEDIPLRLFNRQITSITNPDNPFNPRIPKFATFSSSTSIMEITLDDYYLINSLTFTTNRGSNLGFTALVYQDGASKNYQVPVNKISIFPTFATQLSHLVANGYYYGPLGSFGLDNGTSIITISDTYLVKSPSFTLSFVFINSDPDVSIATANVTNWTPNNILIDPLGGSVSTTSPFSVRVRLPSNSPLTFQITFSTVYKGYTQQWQFTGRFTPASIKSYYDNTQRSLSEPILLTTNPATIYFITEGEYDLTGIPTSPITTDYFSLTSSSGGKITSTVSTTFSITVSVSTSNTVSGIVATTLNVNDIIGDIIVVFNLPAQKGGVYSPPPIAPFSRSDDGSGIVAKPISPSYVVIDSDSSNDGKSSVVKSGDSIASGNWNSAHTVCINLLFVLFCTVLNLF